MDNIKDIFIELAIASQVLKFGQFTLKSGRQSPYFFNAGEIYTANNMRVLGQCYAQTIINNDIKFDHLFGPAYKGIPIVTATAVALAEAGIDKTITFNRKEAKGHGEGGVLIGAPLSGKTLIVDDVISAGTAFNQAKTLVQNCGSQVSGVLIALDRCERGKGELSARDEIKNIGIEFYSIITLFDLMDYLEKHQKLKQLENIKQYHQEYGA